MCSGGSHPQLTLLLPGEIFKETISAWSTPSSEEFGFNRPGMGMAWALRLLKAPRGTFSN